MSENIFAGYRRKVDTFYSSLLTIATALGESRIYRGVICQAIERKSKF